MSVAGRLVCVVRKSKERFFICTNKKIYIIIPSMNTGGLEPDEMAQAFFNLDLLLISVC